MEILLKIRTLPYFYMWYQKSYSTKREHLIYKCFAYNIWTFRKTTSLTIQKKVALKGSKVVTVKKKARYVPHDRHLSRSPEASILGKKERDRKMEKEKEIYLMSCRPIQSPNVTNPTLCRRLGGLSVKWNPFVPTEQKAGINKEKSTPTPRALVSWWRLQPRTFYSKHGAEGSTRQQKRGKELETLYVKPSETPLNAPEHLWRVFGYSADQHKASQTRHDSPRDAPNNAP